MGGKQSFGIAHIGLNEGSDGRLSIRNLRTFLVNTNLVDTCANKLLFIVQNYK